MPIESGSTIAELDKLWPLSGDPTNEGDNHFRLIKAVLKTQFPGSGGNGYAQPIIATELELNYLTGVTSNVQEQIDAIVATTDLVAPQGTVMVFFQAAPPAGWTQLGANNDSMLRVVSGVGGAAGGSASPINFSHNHSTGSHSLTGEQNGPHTHGFDDPVPVNDNAAGALLDSGNDFRYRLISNTESSGSGEPHNHGNTGSKAITLRYINVITAVKD